MKPKLIQYLDEKGNVDAGGRLVCASVSGVRGAVYTGSSDERSIDVLGRR